MLLRFGCCRTFGGGCSWTQRAKSWDGRVVSNEGSLGLLQLFTMVLTIFPLPVLDLPEFEGPWNVGRGSEVF